MSPSGSHAGSVLSLAFGLLPQICKESKPLPRAVDNELASSFRKPRFWKSSGPSVISTTDFRILDMHALWPSTQLGIHLTAFQLQGYTKSGQEATTLVDGGDPPLGPGSALAALSSKISSSEKLTRSKPGRFTGSINSLGLQVAEEGLASAQSVDAALARFEAGGRRLRRPPPL
ncbi:hypothetical protein DFH08DRAFT_828261 [Mycena albidolilacea]|uniref:Uncharacterized protein n=1 Tax=Mycena albidolilacea TaxID=1033008 RepID=A0AAD6YWZ6_9AGAR|nr:hypothetical protein DFH08DRAFT_828261 [Mycena albidolilacea]